MSGKDSLPLLHLIPCVSKIAVQCLLSEPCTIFLVCTEVLVLRACRSQQKLHIVACVHRNVDCVLL